MEPAPRVGQVFFPLDEELALQPGTLTPKQQEHLAHLAVWMPFERARQMLERLLGVQVSEPTVRRGTERAGAVYEAWQHVQSQQDVPLPCALHGDENRASEQVHISELSYFSRMTDAETFGGRR